MPNWCNNEMKLAKEYHGKVLNEKNEVDFNILMPMPESLNVTAGSSNERDIYVYLSEKGMIPYEEVLRDPMIAASLSGNNNLSPPLKELLSHGFEEHLLQYSKGIETMDAATLEKSYQDGKILIDNYRNYGYIHWYDWCSNVWGVKWNASDSHTDGDKIYFDTPWGPPIGWLNKLASMNIPFSLEWREEGGTCGTIISQDGLLLEEDRGCWYDDEDEENEEEEK